jgi:hypothetical protein
MPTMGLIRGQVRLTQGQGTLARRATYGSAPAPYRVKHTGPLWDNGLQRMTSWRIQGHSSEPIHSFPLRGS